MRLDEGAVSGIVGTGTCSEDDEVNGKSLLSLFKREFRLERIPDILGEMRRPGYHGVGHGPGDVARDGDLALSDGAEPRTAIERYAPVLKIIDEPSPVRGAYASHDDGEHLDKGDLLSKLVGEEIGRLAADHADDDHDAETGSRFLLVRHSGVPTRPSPGVS